jgi:hypothetical protein
MIELKLESSRSILCSTGLSQVISKVMLIELESSNIETSQVDQNI